MIESDHVVDAIDNALYDWTVSGDAMRWTPDAPRVPAAPRLPDVSVLLRIDVRPFQEAMKKVAVAVAKATPALKAFAREMARQEERAAARRHQPIALRIDGHEYRRRSKKRRQA